MITDFTDANRKIVMLRAQLQTNLRIAAMRTVQAGYDRAIVRSSGRIKAKDMRKTRPFAKWHPGALLPPDIINSQTDGFRQDWRAIGPVTTQNGFEGQIRNDNPVTKFFSGTRFMHARPIEEELTHEVADIGVREMTDAVQRLLQHYA